MPRAHDRLIDRLDAAAEFTRIPGLMAKGVRRRHWRWLPMIALGLAVPGFLIGLVRTDLSEIGFGAAMLGFALAIWLPILGPVKPWGAMQRVDEFDRQLRSRAFFAAFASVSAAAFIALQLVMALALLDRWDSLTTVLELRTLSILLLVLYAAVPTLYASWTTRPLDDD